MLDEDGVECVSLRRAVLGPSQRLAQPRFQCAPQLCSCSTHIISAALTCNGANNVWHPDRGMLLGNILAGTDQASLRLRNFQAFVAPWFTCIVFAQVRPLRRYQPLRQHGGGALHGGVPRAAGQGQGGLVRPRNAIALVLESCALRVAPACLSARASTAAPCKQSPCHVWLLVSCRVIGRLDPACCGPIAEPGLCSVGTPSTMSM